MEVFLRQAVAYLLATICATCIVVQSSKAQDLSAKPSDAVLRERIATIFRETFKRGESTIEQKGLLVKGRTFVPPSTEHVDEIVRYGDDAVPILAEYLTGSGFEKYLAMRFLGLIGSKSVVEPLRKVALTDDSSSFRSVALIWLGETPWALASPIINQAATHDASSEVRDRAKHILAQHVVNR